MAVRCPYGENMPGEEQCRFAIGHYGPHSYELEEEGTMSTKKYVTASQKKVTYVTINLPSEIALGVAECIDTYADGGFDAREPELRAAVDEVSREIHQVLDD